MDDQRFLACHRVRLGGDFQRAFRRRSSAADSSLIVFGYPNGLTHPRLGLSVSRRIGGAVVRNRWKRLLREAFRLTRSRLPVAVDLIVVPRAGSDANHRIPTLAALSESLVRLGKRVEGKLRAREGLT
jgi:ribonuclease P protein component